MRLKQLLTAVAAASLALAPGEARDWPSAGGWDIGEMDDGCLMLMEYEGEGTTTLYVSLTVGGGTTLAVANSNWSIKKGEKYDLQFVLNGKQYSGGAAIGAMIGLKPAIFTRMGVGFLSDFAKGTGLTIYRGKVIVDDLSLSGTAAAAGVLRRCAATVQARLAAEAREKARLAHIPSDPFADPASAKTDARAEPARPRANLSSYISDADYPDSALRAAEAGTVDVKLTIGIDGRVTNCVVTRSSGSPALDSATCRILRSRARFTPAHDERGGPVEGEAVASHSWQLPK